MEYVIFIALIVMIGAEFWLVCEIDQIKRDNEKTKIKHVQTAGGYYETHNILQP